MSVKRIDRHRQSQRQTDRQRGRQGDSETGKQQQLRLWIKANHQFKPRPASNPKQSKPEARVEPPKFSITSSQTTNHSSIYPSSRQACRQASKHPSLVMMMSGGCSDCAACLMLYCCYSDSLYKFSVAFNCCCCCGSTFVSACPCTPVAAPSSSASARIGSNMGNKLCNLCAYGKFRSLTFCAACRFE